MVDISTELSGVKLDNPIIPASGTFGFGAEFNNLYDINILGSFSFKGTTKEPRFGNPTPRIAECRDGMINSVGLANPGIDAVINEELPALRDVFHKPIIANISGFSVDEYKYCCERMNKEDQVEILEVNISCPNVHAGGMAFGTSPDAAAEVTAAVKSVTDKPVYMKLSPNVTSITPELNFETGGNGKALLEAGITTFKVQDRGARRVIVVNSEQPNGLDLYINRVRNYIVKEFALHEFLGERNNDVTINEIKHEVDRVRDECVNVLNLLEDIKYTVAPESPSCVGITVDSLIFAGIITRINVYVRVEVE